ncbi:MAG TPA: alpha/beta fold hydrolase [Steroidobacteraceae bacterium]|jgi:pimeloyl-ACP methyl ester carboxylesterase|nr:alpha/beta fold hydrolase [Steroidobacteraceae bacterium]
MRQVTGALVWVGLGVYAWWALPAAAEEPATLPLIECRLEHPLHLTSIPARCGTLRVPLDREHPKEGSVDLKVAVVPALSRRSTAAPLFLLAGGPGQSAMQVYVSLNSAFSRINRNHAIVLLDQRGTGHSSLQSCAYPEDWQEPADPIPALRKATVECLAKLGPHVRFYTTSIAVRDLDDMRIALGYDQIDLYGGSYGTRVAELYMRRYPAHVQGVILDGVTYPQQSIGAETPQDAERSLNLIVARCLQSPDCAATYPQLQDDLTNLLREYGPKKTPVTIDDPNSGLPLDIEFNRRILDAALRMLSYSSMQASLLPTLIHGAAHGKLRPLAAQSVMNMRQISDQLANGMQYSVICSEDEPFFAAANIDRAAMAKTYQGTDMMDALHEICGLWPRGPVDADLHAPLHSEVPTLLLSGEADPVTPPVDAERAAVGLTRHRHLILKGEGHGQLATGCMPTLTADFLDNLAPDKLDATCLDRHTPEPFFLSMTGPAP